MSLFDLACQQTWAIQEEWLRRILALTNREDLDPAWARAIREDRASRPSAVAARRGDRLEGTRDVRVRDGVAILEITGPIVRRADLFSDISGATSVETLARDFATAQRDASVEAILLAFDSPGGEVTGINEFAQHIYDARKGDKPVWAYVEGLGASAAYWLASAADRIVVDETAILGSIGVVMAVPDPERRKSTEIEIVSSQSPNKRPNVTTEKGRALLQTIVDDTAAVFVATVARNRKVSEETVLRDFGQGGVMVGKVATVAGLADKLGSFEQTLIDIRQAAMKKRQRPRMAAQEERMKVSELIAGIFAGAKDAGIELEADALPAEPTTTTTTAATAATVSADQDVQAARLAELEKQLAEQRTTQIAQSAATFADGAIRDRRAFPAERAALIALYTQAAQDDGAAPVAEGLPTRVAQIEASLASRPQHSLSAELIATGPGGALPDNAGPKQMSAERRQALLAMTPLGQAVLARERAKSA